MKNRRPWTEYEDQILKYIHESEPAKRWSYVAKKMHDQYQISGRSEKQCRDRYEIYIKSKTQIDNWDSEKEQKMFSLHKKYGNKWGLIATHFDRKNGPFIKNQFYSRLRRSLRKINHLIHSYYKKEFEQFQMKMAYTVATYVDKKIKEKKQAPTKESSNASTTNHGSSPITEGDDYEIIHKLLLFSDDNQPKVNSSFFVENSFLEDIINQLVLIREGKDFEKEKRESDKDKRESLQIQEPSEDFQNKRTANIQEHGDASNLVRKPASLQMVDEESEQECHTERENKMHEEEGEDNIPLSDLNWKSKYAQMNSKSKSGKESNRSDTNSKKNYEEQTNFHRQESPLTQEIIIGGTVFADRNRDTDRTKGMKTILLEKKNQGSQCEKKSEEDGSKKNSDGNGSKKNSEQSKKYSKSSNSKNNNSNDDSKKDSKDSSKRKSLTPLMSINSKPSENPNSSNVEMREINSDDKVSKNNSQIPFLSDSSNNKNKFEHVLSLANNYEQESDREYSVISKLKEDLLQDIQDKRARSEYMEYENCFVFMQAEENSYP